MIKGFEEITKDPLSGEEMAAVPHLLDYFRENCMGKKNAATNKILCRYLYDITGAHIQLDSVRVRKVIAFMRTNFPEMGALLANSKGYWISSDPEEINDYRESLNGRINAIRRVLYYWISSDPEEINDYRESLNGRINAIRRVLYHIDKHYIKNFANDSTKNAFEAGEAPEAKDPLEKVNGAIAEKIRKALRPYQGSLFDTEAIGKNEGSAKGVQPKGESIQGRESAMPD